MTATLTRQAAPHRSLEQRMNALAKGNRIRTFRARAKEDIAAGRRDPLALLLNPPEKMATMKVLDLLLTFRGVGRVKANRALTRCRISPSKTLGGMTDRQRRELARDLAPGVPERVGRRSDEH